MKEISNIYLKLALIILSILILVTICFTLFTVMQMGKNPPSSGILVMKTEVDSAAVFDKREYKKLVESKTPNSKLASNMAKAFLVGGLICVVGQIVSLFFKSKGLSEDAVSGITAIFMIFAGGLLTGLNVYDEIGRFGGAGSIVPITGFANSIVSPAMEHKSEGYVTGVGARMFEIAGPVLVYGVVVSTVAGILYYMFISYP